MNIKDKLQIYLVTYNRKQKLKETLSSILASPIRDFDITILDNASTDGTSELIEEYCKKFSNITHIRHKCNIGGNANICRAYEMGASCGKDYVWVLCDDDKYDFSNWSEVEKAIEANFDVICVADYIYPKGQKDNKAYQVFQLTFVPAGIYKTKNITDDIIINMYDSVYTMFQQSCIAINVINNNGKIFVLDNPVVFNGLHFEDRVENISYTRGQKDGFVSDRRANTNWILGFSNIVSLLKNKNLQKDCIEVAIPYKDIYGSWNNFYNCLNNEYLNVQKFNYFIEVYKMLNIKQQKEFQQLYGYNLAQVKSGLTYNYSLREIIWYFLRQIFSIKLSDNRLILTILGIKIKAKKNGAKTLDMPEFRGGG